MYVFLTWIRLGGIYLKPSLILFSCVRAPSSVKNGELHKYSDRLGMFLMEMMSPEKVASLQLFFKRQT